nr:palmitoyl-acyl carrier protein thioesterase, chloroplastic [Quercus suber]
MSSMKPDTLSQPAGVASTYNISFTSVNRNSITTEELRQNIPTKKRSVDPHPQGLIIEGGVGYRQTVVIRGEVVEIDTWVGASEKNGMRRDWLVRSQATGHVFARATSTWVMMNQETRRLSKMPEEVRAEISPWFIDKQAIKEDCPEKIVKLDSKARYMDSNLKAKRSDLEMNHHVNNVKYVRWMLETIPDEILGSHKLSTIILEYRRECGNSDIVQLLCHPDEGGILEDGLKHKNGIGLNGFSLASEILEGSGLLCSFEKVPLRYTHLLQVKGEGGNEEIVRGRTTWKRKMPTKPFTTW